MKDDFLTELRKIEKKWQKKWKDEEIFISKIDTKKPKWFITVPYPYATGPLHIGHCRTYNLGDIFARYKRQSGYNVFFPMAFHITGTPVLSVADRLKKREPKYWDLYKDYVSIYEKDEQEIEKVLKSFAEPMNVAMYFSGKLIQDFQRMGFSIDSTHQFTTGDPEYNRFIEWQYKVLNDKGYITKGSYPILWCPNDNNAVGEDDIQSGDEQKVEVQELVGIKYRLRDKKYLVAATLRPETIFGITNVWIHPDRYYVEIKINSETWIVSKEAIEKLKLQNQSFTEVRSFFGEELIGQSVEVPITKKKVPIYPATFVDTDHATGVVYSVPGHAPYDYIALVDLQKDENTIVQYTLDNEELQALQPISIISNKDFGDLPAVEICKELGVNSQLDEEKLERATQTIYKTEFYNGIMKDNTGELQGLRVEEAKNRAEQMLIEKELGMHFYEPSIEAKCRCGAYIEVAVIPDQYFLNYGDPEWKKKALDELNNMMIIPPKFRQSFENVFDWLDKRPCVRRRGLGTEFPLEKGKGWIIESLSDSVIYMAFYTIIKKMREHGISDKQLIPEFFDYVFLRKGRMKDLSEKIKIPVGIIKEIRNEFVYWYPNDFRHTAIAHISNHLSFAIFHHAAIFPKKYWLQAFSLNDLLIREGSKMGKSKGNVIPMAYIPDQYSVDLTRLHLAAVAAADSIVDWRDKEVENSKKKLRRFYEYAQSISNVRKDDKIHFSFRSNLLVSSTKLLMNKAIQAIKDFNAREFIQTGFFNVVNELDQYDKDMEDIQERNQVIRSIFEDLVVILTPVIPHLCEEIYDQLGLRENKSDFCTNTLIPSITVTNHDRILAEQAKFLSQLAEDIDQIVSLIKQDPNSIYIYINEPWKNTLYQLTHSLFEHEAIDIKKIMSAAKKIPELQNVMKEVAQEVKFMQKSPNSFRIDMLSPNNQQKAIEGYIDILKKKYRTSIIIANAGRKDIYDPSNKRLKARPMKPAIYIE
ncbi:MAG: leucine--tRNA ligase [Candidatus Lokiarchaeota archaeon]|nr:leucine--tRNA ligase [Candidatus Lokiarchaeota archaeon]